MSDVVKTVPKDTVIRKIKRPDGIARWAAYQVTEDEFGVWLFSPKGTLYRGQKGTTIGECEVGQGAGDEGVPVIQLMPRSRWWTAMWRREHYSMISVDICTPPAVFDDEWTYVDLELDPVMGSTGNVEIEDEDEFVEACKAGFISDAEAANARAATLETAQAMRDRTEPFHQRGWERLDQALSLTLPPIKSLRHVPFTPGNQ